MDTAAENLEKRAALYTTIYSQAYSACGRYLATSDNFGRISIFDTNALGDSLQTNGARKPAQTFQGGGESPLYALVTVKDYLVSGGSNGISLWKWDSLIRRNKDEKLQSVWSTQMLAVRSSSLSPEINCLSYTEQNNLLCGACGDGTVRVWDLETGTEKEVLAAHKDMVLSVATGTSILASASEDGTVKTWDYRKLQKATHSFEPSSNKSLSQPAGKWIGAVGFDSGEEWLACGGGPKPGLWHLKSLHLASALNTNGATTHDLLFHDDELISVGNDSRVHHWSLNGDARSHIPSAVGTLYSVASNSPSAKTQMMTTAGCSSVVDVYTNMKYRAFSLSLEDPGVLA
ncbi:THO complex subunit 6 homolog [Oscarella lobularis]|uniref:THO complex subunit 6 homolog n=1 Tax=Oscarella lobularis TaxID=121494 RepID=UPI003313437E